MEKGAAMPSNDFIVISDSDEEYFDNDNDDEILADVVEGPPSKKPRGDRYRFK